MNNLQKILLLACVVAVPAAAQSLVAPANSPCFTAGAWTYQLSSKSAAPDYRVRVKSDSRPADLVMQVVDSPEVADFVIADDPGSAEPDLCSAVTGLKTVRVGTDEDSPDVTVELSREADTPDYRLYVHSARFSHQDAAALLAVMWKAKRSAAR